MSRCTCGGANDNCYRCYGTGIARSPGEEPIYRAIQSRRRKAPSATPKKTPRAAVERPLRLGLACPHCSLTVHDHLDPVLVARNPMMKIECNRCGEKVTVRKAARHFRSCPRKLLGGRPIRIGHTSPVRRRKSAPKPAPTGPRGHLFVRTAGTVLREVPARIPPAPQERCPVCSWAYANLERHLATRHRNSMVNCPTCGVSVAGRNAARHRERCPKRPLQLKGVGRRKTAANQPPVAPARSSRRSKVRIVSLDGPDALDATRSYARRFRESGRFGSHAAHDDYSEDADA
jgi:endogenous inhibitor of DNA gyrase (YacG/DUF329 family)